MALRLLFVALIANLIVIVICTADNEASSSSATATRSNIESRSSTSTVQSSPTSSPKSKIPKRCRRLKKCPKNEEFSYCPQSLNRAQYCSQKGNFRCTDSNEPCKQGCVCKEDYLRADNGTCIPEEQCEITCGDNGMLVTCPAKCAADYCPTKDAEPVACKAPKICPPPACKCAFNYRFADNGTCIPTTSCPPFDCSARPNEEYNACPPLCPSDDCSLASPTGECPKALGRIGVRLLCNPRCRCIKGYWRKDGICVPYGECSGVCPPHERYSECIQAECRALNCTQIGKSIPCPRIRPEFCLKGCVCEEGYLRGKNGTCVPEDQCQSDTCPPNEEFVSCIQGVCRAMNCSQKGQDVPCPDVPKEQCDSGCICKENFLRTADGTCIPEDQCEPACPSNEEWSKCAQATCRVQNCTQIGKPIACPMIADGYCIKDCVCKENYLRDENGDCIPQDQCPPQITCSENEVASNCPSTCTFDDCPKSAAEENVCITSNPCRPACKCSFNYRRAANGTCIPTEECPPFDCSARPNEEYDPCPALCPTDGCSLPRVTGICPFRIGIVLECNPQCQCKDGYGRSDGICVPFSECPNLCPANEEYSSCTQGTGRPQKCEDRDNANDSSSTVDKTTCKKGCVCKENYYRNATGNCVPYDECTAPITCGENEVATNGSASCISDYCPKSADENQSPVQSDSCLPACKCKFNYKRAANGTCIPTKECPPFDCSAQPNQEYDPCPAICPSDECSLPRVTGICPYKIGIVLECNPKCQCKDGYGRSNEVCVPFSECPNLCPVNEEYSPCTQETGRPQKCEDRDNVNKSSIAVDDDSCERGCVCKENYYRNGTGNCVPYGQCEAQNITCGDNEVASKCPPSCTFDYCPKSADEKQVCVQSDPCQPGCRCRFNYRRADNGTCIPTRSCPPFDCSDRPNEEYNACPVLCPTDECSLPWVNKRCPYRIGIILDCKPKCQCKNGYGRVNGTCVPYSKCPNLCPANEEYSSCTQAVCRPQKCEDRDDNNIWCPEVDKNTCKKGCVCKENYYRNDKGNCISYAECGGTT